MGWLKCKSETVILLSRTETGRDSFNVPIYAETETEINNVLVNVINLSSSSSDVINAINLSGKKISYELCIPKNDTNIWENRDVIVRGNRYRTVGLLKEWVNPPLDWNRKIMVERYE